MANEFGQMSVMMNYRNGNLVASPQYSASGVDQTTAGKSNFTVSVGTTEQDITFPTITRPGFIEFISLDDKTVTNTVQWGPKSGGVMIRLGILRGGGPPAFFELDGLAPVTLRMKAIGAPVKVEFFVFEF